MGNAKLLLGQDGWVVQDASLVKRAFWKRFGPGILVTAAFVGPGTITTATKAGASHGTALIWALVIAVVAAVILQEMAARLGIVTRRGLGETLVTLFPTPIPRVFMIGMVLGAILVGNTAYQAGNLTGAAAGLEALLGGSSRVWILLSGVVAMLLLALGAYRSVQTGLIGLVGIMSAVFVGGACLSFDQWRLAVTRPALPDQSLSMVLGLIGTTVVPYNLFLHARSVQEKWSEDVETATALREARWDALVAIVLGGVITLAVLLTAVATFYGTPVAFESLGQGARQLEPVIGAGAQGLFAVGLFAAGLTSAITAPLAAAYATQGCLGWEGGWRDRKFLATAMLVVVIGVVVALTAGRSPQALILFAQTANGVLLPFVAATLLVVMNSKKMLGEWRNGLVSNALGGLVVLGVSSLAGWKLWQLWIGS